MHTGFDLRDWLLVILPLAGVIVGGLLTGGVELAFRRADERKARRLGARVVLDELSSAAGMLTAARAQRAVSALPDSDRLVGAWREHRTAFAALDFADWMPIQEAVSALQIFSDIFAGAEWDEEGLDKVFPQLIMRIDRAVEALRPHV